MIWETSIDSNNAEQSFRELVDAWKQDRAKVFVLRGQDIGANPRAFYDSHFADIGRPVALAEDVILGSRDQQRTGEIWMEVRYDPQHPDAYRHSANAQPLHTDGSYIPSFPNATLMACVANAGEGGETTFIDADDLVACLEQEAPDLLDELESRTMPHARSGDRREEKVIERSGDSTLVSWNYYCVDPNVDAEGRALADRFFNYLRASPLVKERTHAVKLGPGDAVTWKDRRVLHGRNSFMASRESERFLWKCAIDVGNFDGD
ncbi:TauD/TfdA family dioxygenase [Allosphingosinicella sp.]|uniref:TauD/TfdA family dioxygenase n=1 Tax=Allosphingosinicella sp. TaxID=2823234 RepID=UPI002FC176C4